MVVEACWFERVTSALEGRENRRVSHLLLCSSQEVDRGSTRRPPNSDRITVESLQVSKAFGFRRGGMPHRARTNMRMAEVLANDVRS